MGTLSVDKLVKTSSGAAEFTLPATDATAGQVLQTDGSGQLSVAALAADTVTATQIAANAVTPAQLASSVYNANRNIVINGAMQVSQRSTVNVASITTTGYHTVDRWETQVSSLGTWTQGRDADSPDGFGNSLKMDCTTADAAPGASDYLGVRMYFEGQDLQQLKKGTASAESVTLSFWVKSTKIGTFVAELKDYDNSRMICKSYTVDVSGVWEYKTITFAGDTTGAMDDDNAASLQVHFWLAAGTDFTSGTLATTWQASTNANRAVGQVNIADSTSNDFFLTGVQLEIGTNATPYEYKTYGQELAACQRYFQVPYNWWAHSDASTATAWKFVHDFPVDMRASPTLTAVGTPTVNKMNANAAGPNSIATPGTANKSGFQLSFTTMATGSGSAAATNTPYAGYGGFNASAEL